MPKAYKQSNQKLDRLIDANFNRAKEGLRVCEDFCRFVLDAQGPTRRLKALRHQLTDAMSSIKIEEIIRARDIRRDCGRTSTRREFQRRDMMDVFYANAQRVKESIRVLEEVTKLRNKQLAEKLKKLRYKIYALEKNIIEQCNGSAH